MESRRARVTFRPWFQTERVRVNARRKRDPRPHCRSVRDPQLDARRTGRLVALPSRIPTRCASLPRAPAGPGAIRDRLHRTATPGARGGGLAFLRRAWRRMRSPHRRERRGRPRRLLNDRERNQGHAGRKRPPARQELGGLAHRSTSLGLHRGGHPDDVRGGATLRGGSRIAPGRASRRIAFPGLAVPRRV